MTNSELFTAAHKLARTFEGDYRACFALALKEIRSMKKPNIIKDTLALMESKKAGSYGTYFLTSIRAKENEVLGLPDNTIVIAYKRGASETGVITNEGDKYILDLYDSIPDSFFNEKESDCKIYLGEGGFTGFENGLLTDLYQTTIGEIKSEIKADVEKRNADVKAAQEINAAKKSELKRKQAELDKLGPNDILDSGYGYSVRKKNYHLAQKYGYDGIELI